MGGEMSRRDLLRHGSAALAGMALLQPPWLARAFPSRPGEEVIPWADQPPPNPAPAVIGNLHRWEDLLASWLTPSDKFFTVAHYQGPADPALDADRWRLQVTGLVQRPLTLTLRDLQARPRQELTFTLECSGNHGLPGFSAGIGNAQWAGTPLAPLLQEVGILGQGTEVVFFGGDAGEEEVRGIKMRQNFARSLSVADATHPDHLLCYEMNGEPLPQRHGFPLRLITPGWYGIANVKWLTRIEVHDRRYMGRFMARDYVTIREEPRDGETVWMETSVGPARLKSAPGRVTRKDGQYRIIGAAWGAPIQRVEVQIDGGAWVPATIDRSEDAEFAWKIWSLEWEKPAPGEHTITSRAVDTAENVQPAMDDPWIANKRTYWESNGQVTRRIKIS